MTWSVENKTCIVTGASNGIGLETARALAKDGANVVLVCRSAEKAAEAKADIERTTGSKRLSVELCDFSSQASIRAAAARITAAHEHIHVLVNNAGAVYMQREETVDGLEKTFATNHLGYFLFTNLLLDTLKKSAPARIVNVASMAHMTAKLDFGDLQHERSFSGIPVYNESKLANIYFTYELAERLAGTGVTANCLHPGVIASGFGHNNTGLMKFFVTLGKPFLATTEKGARTQIFLATSPSVEGITGKYFSRSKEKKSSSVSYDVSARKTLWEKSAELTQLS